MLGLIGRGESGEGVSIILMVFALTLIKIKGDNRMREVIKQQLDDYQRTKAEITNDGQSAVSVWRYANLLEPFLYILADIAESLDTIALNKE